VRKLPLALVIFMVMQVIIRVIEISAGVE